MQMKHLIRVGIVACWVAVGSVQAQPACCDERGMASRQYLSQGIALFEVKDYKEAERALHAALTVARCNARQAGTMEAQSAKDVKYVKQLRRG